MDDLHHYKLWNADLGQYVAQAGRLTRERIAALGGVVIGESPGGLHGDADIRRPPAVSRSHLVEPPCAL